MSWPTKNLKKDMSMINDTWVRTTMEKLFERIIRLEEKVEELESKA